MLCVGEDDDLNESDDETNESNDTYEESCNLTANIIIHEWYSHKLIMSSANNKYTISCTKSIKIIK